MARSIIRARQGVITRLTPHQGNRRVVVPKRPAQIRPPVPELPLGPEVHPDPTIAGACGDGTWNCSGGAAIAGGEIDTGPGGNVQTVGMAGAALFVPWLITLQLRARPGMPAPSLQFSWGQSSSGLQYWNSSGERSAVHTRHATSGHFQIQGTGGRGAIVERVSVRRLLVENAGTASWDDGVFNDPYMLTEPTQVDATPGSQWQPSVTSGWTWNAAGWVETDPAVPLRLRILQGDAFGRYPPVPPPPDNSVLLAHIAPSVSAGTSQQFITGAAHNAVYGASTALGFYIQQTNRPMTPAPRDLSVTIGSSNPARATRLMWAQAYGLDSTMGRGLAQMGLL